jgi:hypothetical protein
MVRKNPSATIVGLAELTRKSASAISRELKKYQNPKGYKKIRTPGGDPWI